MTTTANARGRLLAGLAAGDTDDEQLAKTWIAAQDLRLPTAARGRPRAEEHLYRWLTHCADAGVPELRRLARTIDSSWRDELLAYFDTRRGLQRAHRSDPPPDQEDL